MPRTSLIFLDTETTGLVPTIHCPWEIAWVTAVHDTEEGTLMEVTRRQAFVEMDEMQQANADPFALQVGKFQERYVEMDSVVWTDVVDQLRYDILRCRAVAAGFDKTLPPMDEFDAAAPPIHLVGAIPSFDHAMICSNWTGWPAYGEGLWHYHLVDIEALAVGYINGVSAATAPGPSKQLTWPVRSDDLATPLSVPLVEESLRHTAMGDALYVQAMYRAVYGLTQTVWIDR